MYSPPGHEIFDTTGIVEKLAVLSFASSIHFDSSVSRSRGTAALSQMAATEGKSNHPAYESYANESAYLLNRV